MKQLIFSTIPQALLYFVLTVFFGFLGYAAFILILTAPSLFLFVVNVLLMVWCVSFTVAFFLRYLRYSLKAGVQIVHLQCHTDTYETCTSCQRLKESI